MTRRLMLVTDRNGTGKRDLVDVVAAAVTGGVDVVQVREKDLPDDALFELTNRVIEAVAGRAEVLINGRPELATRMGVGLHLPTGAAAPHKREWPVWGRSVHSVEEAIAAAIEEPDYLVLGTIFPTSSKPGHLGSGLPLIEAVTKAMFPLPVFAIGGITSERATSVLAAGATGIAVQSAILKAPSPEDAARVLRAGFPTQD